MYEEGNYVDNLISNNAIEQEQKEMTDLLALHFRDTNRNTEEYRSYTDWQDTAHTVHLLLQMAGKVKVVRCDKRPEWSHIRLYLTLDGLSTGIVPCNESPFVIHFNFREDSIFSAFS